jgi:maleylpyruvate isomerase
VRIALGLKGLAYEYVPVNLQLEEHRQAEFGRLNPQKLVPALEFEGQIYTQSLTIIDFLEMRFPEPPLYPTDAAARLQVEACAQLIACDIHPINNRRILMYLRQQLGQPEEAVQVWTRHWIIEGFQALTELLERAGSQGRYCIGNYPTVADICLIPQVESARRFGVDLALFPLIQSIDQHCSQIEAFAAAAPSRQIDAK